MFLFAEHDVVSAVGGVPMVCFVVRSGAVVGVYVFAFGRFCLTACKNCADSHRQQQKDMAFKRLFIFSPVAL